MNSNGKVYSLSDREPISRLVTYEGTAIVGTTGAGKSMSSGKLIARGMLKDMYGGLVLTAKPDDLAMWAGRYFANTGRPPSEDMAVIAPASPHPEAIWPGKVLGDRRVYRFNVLQEEFERGGRLTANVVNLLLTSLTQGDVTRSNSDPYWFESLRELLTNTIDLVVHATVLTEGRPRLRLAEILEVVRSAPQSLQDLSSDRFRNGLCFRYLQTVDEGRERLSGEGYADLKETVAYWMQGFPDLASRTRSIIVSSLTSKASGLLRSPLRELLCSDSDPEASPLRTFEPCPRTGRPKVLVIDLPVKLYQEVGKFAQVLLKTAWQREADRRAKRIIEHGGAVAPAFLWADEYHHFATRQDALFQTTARSAQVATVYLTQNLPNLFQAIGEEAAHSLLGSLQTKIFHTNGDPETNSWAERAFGTMPLPEQSLSVEFTNPSRLSGSYQQVRQPVVPSIRFTTLRKAGPGQTSEAVVFHPGRRWGVTGVNHLLATFPPPDQD